MSHHLLHFEAFDDNGDRVGQLALWKLDFDGSTHSQLLSPWQDVLRESSGLNYDQQFMQNHMPRQK